MSTARKFEELIVWQKARLLNKIINQQTNKLSFRTDPELKTQLRRSSISISSNIAEGFERGGNREFYNFLSISKGSAGELRSQLYLAADLEHFNQEEFTETYELAESISKMLSSLMDHVQKSPYKGKKYKSNNP